LTFVLRFIDRFALADARLGSIEPSSDLLARQVGTPAECRLET
jgi:phospholipid N-methyltransferase